MKHLEGKRFGKLVVTGLNPVRYIKPNGNKTCRWDCVCDCGKTVTVITDSLTGGHTKSCGCLAKRKDDNEFIGSRFGKLVVTGLNPVRHVYPNGKTSRRWDCVCDCGKTVTVITESLTGGRTKSCGCLQNICIFKDRTGDRYGRLTVLSLAESRTNSKGDSVYYWLCRCDCGREKVVNGSSLGTGDTLSCGCLCSELTSERAKKMMKDNVFGMVEGTELTAIRPGLKLFSTNKSGHRGVYWYAKRGKWGAFIGFKGRNINLGYYSNIIDAIKARARAEDEYYTPILEKYGVKAK